MHALGTCRVTTRRPGGARGGLERDLSKGTAPTPVVRVHACMRAQVDTFNLNLPNIGVLKRIVVGHDNFGVGSDWHLKQVGVGLGPGRTRTGSRV